MALAEIDIKNTKATAAEGHDAEVSTGRVLGTVPEATRLAAVHPE
jgi:hypothetical protein